MIAGSLDSEISNVLLDENNCRIWNRYGTRDSKSRHIYTYICIYTRSLHIRPSHTAAIWASGTSRDVFESIPAEYDWLIEYPTRGYRTLYKLKSDWSSFSCNFDSCLAATNCAVRLYRDIEYSMRCQCDSSLLLALLLCLLPLFSSPLSLSLSLLVSFSHRYWPILSLNSHDFVHQIHSTTRYV